jgi:hypothetical protein
MPPEESGCCEQAASAARIQAANAVFGAMRDTMPGFAQIGKVEQMI